MCVYTQVRVRHGPHIQGLRRRIHVTCQQVLLGSQLDTQTSSSKFKGRREDTLEP